jgi:CBS domain-containing protein
MRHIIIFFLVMATAIVPFAYSYPFENLENLSLVGMLDTNKSMILDDVQMVAYWKSSDNISIAKTHLVQEDDEYYFIFYENEIPKNASLPILVKIDGMLKSKGAVIEDEPSVFDFNYLEVPVEVENRTIIDAFGEEGTLSEQTIKAFGLSEGNPNGMTEEWRKDMMTRFIVMVGFIIFLYAFGIGLLNTKKKNLAKVISENLKAKNFMTRTIITIDEKAPLKEAILLLVRHNLGSLIVLRSEKPIGIITEKDIFKKGIVMSDLKNKLKVKKFMTEGLIMANEDDLIFDVENIMFKNKIRRVPIVSNNKIVGIVTASDLLGIWNEATETEVLKHIRLLDQKLKVKYWMTSNLVEIDIYDKVIEAYDLMNTKNVSDVIVMDGAFIAGILTERDIVSKYLLHRVNIKKTLIKDIIRRRVISIDPDVELFEAAKIMDANHIRRLPIIDDGKLVGIISATDLVKAWARISRQYQ